MYEFLQNHKIKEIKKSVHQLIPDRMHKHEKIIEKIAKRAIEEEAEGIDFIKFLLEVYDAAYVKCIEDHRVELEKRGIKMVPKKSE